LQNLHFIYFFFSFVIPAINKNGMGLAANFLQLSRLQSPLQFYCVFLLHHVLLFILRKYMTFVVLLKVRALRQTVTF